MLVLRRKIGQSITIGEGIEVMVLSVSGSQVRLGTQAPDAVRIDRTEMIAKRLEGANEKRSTSSLLAVDRERMLGNFRMNFLK